MGRIRRPNRCDAECKAALTAEILSTLPLKSGHIQIPRFLLPEMFFGLALGGHNCKVNGMYGIQMRCSLNSLKGDYIGDYIGEYYRGH